MFHFALVIFICIVRRRFLSNLLHNVLLTFHFPHSVIAQYIFKDMHNGLHNPDATYLKTSLKNSHQK